jgi:GNAT superfamily N-acetyltransferase
VSRVEVARVPASQLRAPLRLLEEWLRDGEPVPDGFTKQLQRHVGARDVEILAARLEGLPAGVLILAFRPNVSLGAPFASIEDLYVVPEARRQGVGKALLQAADGRCRSRGVSYLEAQVEEGGAEDLYAAFGYEPEGGVRVFSRSLPLDDNGNEGAGG